MLLLFAGLTAVSAVTTKAQCVDAAREAALAAARGERGAAAGQRVAPPGAGLDRDGGRRGGGDGDGRPVRAIGAVCPADRHGHGGRRGGARGRRRERLQPWASCAAMRPAEPPEVGTASGRRGTGSMSALRRDAADRSRRGVDPGAGDRAGAGRPGVAGAAVGAARVGRHEARTAADLGALAGAMRVLEGPEAACARAGELVSRNGGRLAACTVDGLDIVVAVEVDVTPLPGLTRTARAAARAGPIRAS